MRVLKTLIVLASLATTTALVACGPSSPRRTQPPNAPLPAQQHGSHDTSRLPAAVRGTLDQYVQILASSRSLEECAQRFTSIAGGSLVNEDGRSLRSTVPQYSLKKDHQNVRFYARPAQVTRVQARPNQATGYGQSAIRGTEYKIWIAKARGQPGMPAPITILVPENHPFVRGPKVVGIGSL